MRFTKENINKLLDKLDEMYPDAECALNHSSVFELLVAVVLSAQTTDKSVNLVTPALFTRFPDAHALADADTSEVEALLKRIGMYKTKAKNIISLSQRVVKAYGGSVPEDYDALISLAGVGRKTANVVLSVGFGHQRIAVDTHVFRVSNRIGLVKEKDVLATELSLMKKIPEPRWSKTHHSLIFHGRSCCHARRPKCEACGIAEFCKRIGI